MPITSQESKKFAVATAFSVTLSIMAHVTFLLVVGGVVITEGIVKSSLTAVQPVDVAEELNTEIEEKEKDEEELAMPSPDLGEITQPLESKIIMDSPVPIDTITTDSLEPQSFLLKPQISLPGNSPQPANQMPENEKMFLVKNPPKSMTSLFGSEARANNSLVGDFYDLKQTPNRKESSMAEGRNSSQESEDAKNSEFRNILSSFSNTWRVSDLDKYYKHPDPLSAYQLFIPAMQAEMAPKAFNVDRFVKAKRIAIHYKGNFIAPKTGVFRFVGLADDIMVVRFNNKLVFDGSLGQLNRNATRLELKDSSGYGTQNLFAGSWISMSEKVSYPVEILLGEQPGGYFAAFLMIEEKDKVYEERPLKKGFAYPVFQTISTKMPKYNPENNGPTVAKDPFSGYEETSNENKQ